MTEQKYTAAQANRVAYDAGAPRNFLYGSPHLKHAQLRRMYASLAARVYQNALQSSASPRVLDLGAGEGSATLPFLELGARVTAIDVSARHLELLRAKCARFHDRLEIRCEEIEDTLETNERYDIVLIISTLHHIENYTAALHRVVSLLAPRGQIFSFQDPLRYDTLSLWNKMFSAVAYGSWRAFKADAWGGVKRKMRRARGIYHADSLADSAEFHIVRNGVDQNAVLAQLRQDGFDSELISYFSTQSCFFQPLGTMLGCKNTFAVLARKT